MSHALTRSQDPAVYLVPAGPNQTREDDQIILSALNILTRRMKKKGPHFSNPEPIKQFLMLKTGGLEHEVFSVLFLDSGNNFIALEEIFRGTLNQCSVYPREIAKLALKHGAAAVVLSHNHPSGECTPSRADESLTNVLKTALALVDVRVLDHIIVSANETLSMAERGLM
ncbi:MAG: hypothetical protein A3E79_11820 [Burkholderiales bacterium RIFCSPHIGHO2_12_FULL_61_11]|nr:MAG: hypothetical protein A3E79_11820 [Burkholderiales bacterium RIFCSPHIGHO2_12_FULL_61_11]